MPESPTDDKPDVQQKSAAPEPVLPTDQLDLKARLEADFKKAEPDKTDPVLDPSKTYAPYATEDTDTSSYVGVSPEYMTHASDTEKPHAFAGIEGQSVDAMLGDAFTVGEDPKRESRQTLGGGSNDEVIYTATSGSDVETVRVDRVAEQAKMTPVAKDAESKPVTSTTTPAPAKAPVKAPARPAQ